MKTREQKIEVIYKEIANKELSFGCRFKCNIKESAILWIDDYKNIKDVYWEIYKLSDVIIKWHPVMIGDVLDYIEKEIWIEDLYKTGRSLAMITIIGWLKIWKHKRLPIENQSKECIDYIFNLLEQWKNH